MCFILICIITYELEHHSIGWCDYYCFPYILFIDSDFRLYMYKTEEKNNYYSVVKHGKSNIGKNIETK